MDADDVGPRPPPVEVIVLNTEFEPLVCAAPPLPTVIEYAVEAVTGNIPVLIPPAPPPEP